VLLLAFIPLSGASSEQVIIVPSVREVDVVVGLVIIVVIKVLIGEEVPILLKALFDHTELILGYCARVAASLPRIALVSLLVLRRNKSSSPSPFSLVSPLLSELCSAIGTDNQNGTGTVLVGIITLESTLSGPLYTRGTSENVDYFLYGTDIY